jgi:hypothetical protein
MVFITDIDRVIKLPFCELVAILSSGLTSWEMEPPPGNLNPKGSSTLNRNSHALRQLHP